VALVYLHKIECMRRMRDPRPWPPDVSGEPALSLLDRYYAELRAEFDARGPEAPSHTWYLSEQTVGFWYRRMAQETVIHRVDAEQALGEPLAPIPDDLAVDGVDEVLVRFLSYASVLWHEDFEKQLPAEEPAPVLVRAGEHAWRVRITPDGVLVGPPLPEAGATISGSPEQVLLWLWRRVDGGVDRDGDQELIDTVHTLLYAATQ
jgi:uncharacterized protein (TIGR03083 family)